MLLYIKDTKHIIEHIDDKGSRTTESQIRLQSRTCSPPQPCSCIISHHLPALPTFNITQCLGLSLNLISRKSYSNTFSSCLFWLPYDIVAFHLYSTCLQFVKFHCWARWMWPFKIHSIWCLSLGMSVMASGVKSLVGSITFSQRISFAGPTSDSPTPIPLVASQQVSWGITLGGLPGGAGQGPLPRARGERLPSAASYC